ncbi:MAG: ribulose-phosphate 3-epimerase [Desulfobacterales bacterium]
MKRIAPSLLSADFSRLSEEIHAVEEAGADWIHADVMDGCFVPNITFGPILVAAARRSTRLPLDVHLMIRDPDRFIPEFAKAGADLLSVHVEACPHLHRTLSLIRDHGARPGVALNPATPLEAVTWVLEMVDFVLVMSVNPGFGGQTFIPNALERIRRLRAVIEERGLSCRIEVDGGVAPETIAAIDEAGADIFVAGSAIFGKSDYRAAIAALRERLRGGKTP